MSHKERVCTSDVSDKESEIIEPLLPLEREGSGRPLELDMRRVVNSIPPGVRTGCQ